MLAWTTTALPENAQRTLAEQGVLMWLESLHQRQGGYLRTLAHYNGELDTDKGRTALFQAMLGGTPAILVATGQKNVERKSNRAVGYEGTLDVEVMFFSNHLRSRSTQLIGDEASRTTGYDPGIYRMMDDVNSILMGRSNGACGFGRYMPTFENVLFQTPELTAWRIRYIVPVAQSGYTDSELDPGAVFDSLLAKHNLPSADAVPATINPVVEALTDE